MHGLAQLNSDYRKKETIPKKKDDAIIIIYITQYLINSTAITVHFRHLTVH